jgi:osmotically-inducible protein OsmY
MKPIRCGLATACLLGMGLAAPAFSQPQTPPDNTKVNKADRAQGAPTADQAKNNLSDRDMMQKIRKSVVADKSLSTYAHNCKIIAQEGRVTLKGPVRSEDERRAIEERAREVAGAGNVDNQLTIKAKTDKR